MTQRCDFWNPDIPNADGRCLRGVHFDTNFSTHAGLIGRSRWFYPSDVGLAHLWATRVTKDNCNDDPRTLIRDRHDG